MPEPHELPTTESSDADGGATAPRAAILIGAALLLGMTAVAATVVHDARHRAEIESAVEETAVGDTDCQIIGDRRINHHTVEAVFRGTPLYFAYLKEIKVDDARMRRLGRDDDDRYWIYRPDDPALQQTADGRPLYYIKRKTNKYAQLHDRPVELLPRVLGR